MIYLDSAAIVKLIHREPESDALDLWLAERLGQPRVTSARAEAEVARAILRMAPACPPLARRHSPGRRPGTSRRAWRVSQHVRDLR